MRFKRFEIDQVELLTGIIILKPGKQTKGDKKIIAIHVVVLEDQKDQIRKALKVIYPSIPRQKYPEDIHWKVIENIADIDFTVTE